MGCDSIRDGFIHIDKVGCLNHRYTNDFKHASLP